MKILHYLSFVFAISLMGCSTSAPHAPADAKSETVLVTYHVKPGKEADLEDVLRSAWKIYRQEGMVFAQPHVIVSDTEGDNKPRVVEIFTWVTAPDHAPDAVNGVWNEMHALCEARDGHDGLEFAEVKLIEPKAK
jgi:hypothetical protein